MMHYETPNGPIRVNFLDSNQFDARTPEEAESCEAAIQLLLDLPSRKELTAEIKSAIELLMDKGTCFHPDFFLTEPGLRLNRRIPEAFVLESDLGFSMFEALGQAGLFALLEKRGEEYERHFRIQLFRVIAAICTMLVGVDDIDDMPITVISDVLDHFRTPDGLRWRSGLLTSEEVSATCFREVARAFGRHCNEPSLFEKARNHRISTGKKMNWKFIKANPTGLQGDLIDMYERYSSISRERPILDQQLIMDLDKLLCGLGYNKLLEVVSSPIRKNVISDHYIGQSGTPTGYDLKGIRRAKRFCDFIVSELANEEPDGTYFPIVTDTDVARVQNEVGDRAKKPTQAKARALPERFHWLAKQILEEGATGWPGQNFTQKVRTENGVETMYCPIIPTILRAAFELPLRMVQFRRFDSGEGDLTRYNGKTRSWETNTASNAGYWIRDQSARTRVYTENTRGYAYEFQDDESKITGFFVNTNKSGTPYTIPWMHDELHLLLWELAEWQIKYNPVSAPITGAEYRDSELSKAALANLPDIFALFRAVPTSAKPELGMPVSHGTIGKAFNLLLAETERRWNSLNPENQVSIILRINAKTNQPEKAAYSLHGLRVRGITNLYRAGVPIEILSKLVAGHATVVMTLYYLLFEPAELHAKLTAAMQSTVSTEVIAFVDELKNMKISEAKRRSTYLQESAIQAAITTADKNTFCNVDIGICPYDGTRCNDGGEPLRNENTDKRGSRQDGLWSGERGTPELHYVSPFHFRNAIHSSARAIWLAASLAKKNSRRNTERAARAIKKTIFRKRHRRNFFADIQGNERQTSC